MSGGVLIDANVLIELSQTDPGPSGWAVDGVAAAVGSGGACINPLIYAELAPGFPDRESLDRFLPVRDIRREPLPYEAAFPATRAYRAYRNRGGVRTSCLPDFYIGAHAEVAGHAVMTRDVQRFRTYFPGVELLTPDA